MNYTDNEYLEAIVKPLVSEPDAVWVERSTDERGVLLTIHISKTDMGRVIGKDGNTAKAIRTLLRGFGHSTAAHISLVIAEPEGAVVAQTDTDFVQ